MTVQYASVQFNSSIPTIGLFSIFTSSAWVLTSAIKCWDRKWLQTIYDSYQTAEDVKKLDLVLLSHFHLVAFKIFKGMTRERQGNDLASQFASKLLAWPGPCWCFVERSGTAWHRVALRGTAWRRISIPCFFESTRAVRWGRTWQRCSATTGVVLRVPSCRVYRWFTDSIVSSLKRPLKRWLIDIERILLTWLDCKVGTRPLLMTHPTRAIAPIILQDYLQIRCHGSRVCSCMSCTCRICQSNLQCLFVWKCLKASIVSMVSRTSCMSRGFVFHFPLFRNYLNLWLQDVSAGGCEKTKSKAKEIAESLWVPRLPRCAKSRYRAREEWSKSGDFTFVLTFDDFQNCSKLLPVSAVSGDPLHCWDDRCMLRQGSMPPASGRTTYCDEWINDESTMNYEHLQLWQMCNLLTATWCICILLLASLGEFLFFASFSRGCEKDIWPGLWELHALQSSFARFGWFGRS